MSQSPLPNIKLSLPRKFKTLTKVSEFFSEFGPLSPAVNHDK